MRERDRTENVIAGQGMENVRMLDLVSMQPQQKLGFDWLAPIKNMVLDNPTAKKGRNADEGKSGSVADRHPILTEYAIRSHLQDCTNDGIQQGGMERLEVSMGGKGQWKRRARLQGAGVQEKVSSGKVDEEEVKRKGNCLM